MKENITILSSGPILLSGNMQLQYLLLLLGMISHAIFPGAAYACDPCALYNAAKLSGQTADSFSLSLSEQFTDYDRSGSGRTNVADIEFTKTYSTTQFAAGYDVTDRFGLQISAPLVTRSFTERRRFAESDEVETGIGDAALLLSYSPIAERSVNRSLFFTFSAGVKFPTGDTGSLDESISAEQNEPIIDRLAHHTITTTGAAGGRILSIGSGSFDYIFGASISGRRERLFYLASLQYTIRTEGDFDYRFDNDLVWNSGPGYYLLLEHEQSLAVRAALSGEHKGKDTLSGVEVPGSEISNVFIGPELIAILSSRVTAELGLDLPVSRDTDDALLETDWRVRAGIGYRF